MLKPHRLSSLYGEILERGVFTSNCDGRLNTGLFHNASTAAFSGICRDFAPIHDGPKAAKNNYIASQQNAP
jgi:hypothetical protein